MYLVAALAAVASASDMKLEIGYYSDDKCKHLLKGEAADMCANELDCDGAKATVDGIVTVKDWECEIKDGCHMKASAAADQDKDEFNTACKEAMEANVKCEGNGSGSGDGVYMMEHLTCSSAAALSMAASAIVTVLALF